jgi:hypothetical protein
MRDFVSRILSLFFMKNPCFSVSQFSYPEFSLFTDLGFLWLLFVVSYDWVAGIARIIFVICGMILIKTIKFSQICHLGHIPCITFIVCGRMPYQLCN